MKKMHIKRRKKINKIIIILILIVIILILLFKRFNDKARPLLIDYSKIETKKIVSLIINTSVIKEISNNIDFNSLFSITKDNTGSVKSLDLNSKEANNLIIKASNVVDTNLKYLSEGNIDKLSSEVLNSYDNKKLLKGIFYEIPSGIIIDNVLINNILPKIPVKLNIINNIYCKLSYDVKSYGINSALFTVNIDIVASVKILLPFISEDVEVTTTVPIIVKLIEGNIPSYYINGFNKN